MKGFREMCDWLEAWGSVLDDFPFWVLIAGMVAVGILTILTI